MKMSTKMYVLISAAFVMGFFLFSYNSTTSINSLAVSRVRAQTTAPSSSTFTCSFKPSYATPLTLFSQAARDEFAICGPASIAEYMNAILQFFFRLAIALAVLMIMIGGFQWLMAIGNPGRISSAKDTIQQAVIGLILALTSVLLFNQIDSSFTNLKSLAGVTTAKANCDQYPDQATCDPIASCKWKGSKCELRFAPDCFATENETKAYIQANEDATHKANLQCCWIDITWPAGNYYRVAALAGDKLTCESACKNESDKINTDKQYVPPKVFTQYALYDPRGITCYGSK